MLNLLIRALVIPPSVPYTFAWVWRYLTAEFLELDAYQASITLHDNYSLYVNKHKAKTDNGHIVSSLWIAIKHGNELISTIKLTDPYEFAKLRYVVGPKPLPIPPTTITYSKVISFARNDDDIVSLFINEKEIKCPVSTYDRLNHYLTY